MSHAIHIELILLFLHTTADIGVENKMSHSPITGPHGIFADYILL